ncbi:AMP-binding protein [Microbulbifer aggregans]|uniref:AMP-binding protein n=1 Tax=Microbulbifer aggregans TaxID=1769779 RepID=UPI001CFCF93A|nr:AMP-binding protein [Microbulbifer aggregans]
MQLIETMRCHARHNAEQIALLGEQGGFTYGGLIEEVEQLAEELRQREISVLGLHADNGPAWLLVDLACQLAGVVSVPLPGFFSAGQLSHTLRESGMQALLTDDCARFTALAEVGIASGELAGLAVLEVNTGCSPALPRDTAKITFTSGSTGTPRGVCLSAETQLSTAQALAASFAELDVERHLCVLPLATLLENVAGAYTCWLLGGTLLVPGLEAVGLGGSSQLDAAKLAHCISEECPNSLILLPQMLKALLGQVRQGWAPPESLRFVAVGGGKVAPDLLRAARRNGLPVYEGYGLSECGSVVALNLPGSDCPGAAGRPLSHCEISLREGEIHVRGPRYLGYLGSENIQQEWLATGDLGEVDDAGFVHITGRSKNLLISAYGRNISPEWIESEVLQSPQILQCVVVGDAQPYCSALIFPMPGSAPAQVSHWLGELNQSLPDYARIRHWVALPRPLGYADGLLTANGRPRRERIAEQYRNLIDALYCEPGNEPPFKPSSDHMNPGVA